MAARHPRRAPCPLRPESLCRSIAAALAFRPSTGETSPVPRTFAAKREVVRPMSAGLSAGKRNTPRGGTRGALRFQLMTTHRTIPARSADDKERAAALELTRDDFDAIARYWRAGWINPTSDFFDRCVPRNAFPRSPANGESGLLPRERVLAFPTEDQSDLYTVQRCFDCFALENHALSRADAWRVAIAAVQSSNSELVWAHQPPTTCSKDPTRLKIFADHGLHFRAQPDGAGAWFWVRWDDGETDGTRGATKAEVLAEAEAVAERGGEVGVSNVVPRELMEALYAC